MSEQAVTLLGGPCDGQQVPPFSSMLYIPLTGGGQSRMGDEIDEVAAYKLTITGLTARFVGTQQHTTDK